jgi:hypothetical protein
MCHWKTLASSRNSGDGRHEALCLNRSFHCNVCLPTIIHVLRGQLFWPILSTTQKGRFINEMISGRVSCREQHLRGNIIWGKQSRLFKFIHFEFTSALIDGLNIYFPQILHKYSLTWKFLRNKLKQSHQGFYRRISQHLQRKLFYS